MVLGLNPFLAAVLALAFGVLVGYVIRQLLAGHRINQAETRAQAILAESKSKSQDILLEAKNKSLKLLEDTKREERERREQLNKIENLLAKREEDLDSKSRDISSEKKSLEAKTGELNELKTAVEKTRIQQISELERISSLSREQALSEIMKKLEVEYQDDLYQQLRKLESENKETIDKKAREILTMSIQRYASSHIADATTTIVNLPSDELKGKIIGKEGRNIKAIERLTGVDIIIDDTPETLVISGFDPVRRQVAKLALDKLIADGRIHPAKIEEMVEKAKTEINEKIKEAGEAALFETGAGIVDPKLVYLLGRLAFRTSFGQNVLLHSKVILAMEAHHEEYPYATIESRIVQSADAISGSRPGARRDTVEIYLKRLEDLERIAGSFEGVEKSYAIQAGRELRIFVMPVKIDDLRAIQLAKDIAKKIEEEMKYPGEIKVNVIRETRAIEYAR